MKTAEAKANTTTETAARLIDVVRSVAVDLHPSRPETTVGLDSSLDRDLGFDSLGRAELMARIESAFDVTLADTVFMAAESPRDLLQAVLAAGAGRRGLSDAVDLAAVDLGQAEVVPYSAGTLNEVLDWHAERQPDRPHVRLYADEGDGEVITYRQLQQESRRLAIGLQALDVHPGHAVAIMLPTSREYFVTFFGALLAGCIPVPIYPPARPAKIEEHLRRHVGILNNCRARVLVTSPEIAPAANLLRPHVETLRSIAVADELASSATTELRRPKVSPDDIAFLQYTSGSTGNPKGVTLTHAQLLANIRAMATVLEATPDDVFVSWLPLYHDMGLIGAWLGSLHQATPLVIMPPLSFLAKPLRWLSAIHRYRGTISGGPNFAYELCLRRVGRADLERLDLSSWRVAFNGAEPVSPHTVEHFCERFAASGFRREAMLPVYGLAENCVGLAFPPLRRGPLIDRISRDALAATGHAVPASADDENALLVVACGQPLPDHEFRVVDRAGHELPERYEGRLQFRGPCSTAGYYRDPDATRRLFDGEWLESGDLAYIAEGDVFITGRAKDLIIRAGRNIHPADLEQAIGTIEGILPGRVAAVGSRDPRSGTERLVLITETRKSEASDLERLRAEVNEATTDLIGAPADEVVLVSPNTIPHTSSGKIRRAACLELWEAGLLSRGHRPPWIQVTRLTLAGLVPRFRRALQTTATLLFAAYTWIAVIVVAPIAWLAAVIMPNPAWRWSVLRGCARLLARVTGTPIAVRGLDNLPPAGQACILVSNHASYLDGIALVAVLPRPASFVAKAELSRSWLTRVPLARMGVQFVERFDRQKGIEDFRVVTETSPAGPVPLFFPEGTFRRMPGLLPFHLGAFSAAVETGRPVVPIAIRGTRSILRDDSWYPNRGSIGVTINPPIYPEEGGDPWAATVKLRDLARQSILRHCGEPDLKLEPFLTLPASAGDQKG